METPKIIVRQARREDAATIARAVAMAIGDETALRAYCGEDYLTMLTEIARREGAQYSFVAVWFALLLWHIIINSFPLENERNNYYLCGS